MHASTLPGAQFAYFAVIAGVFVTAFYSFRLYFLVFHGKERWMQKGHHDHHGDDHGEHHHGLGPNDKPHESPWVVTLPLVLLAIPSLLIGYFTIEPMLYGDFFKQAIFVNAELHPAMSVIAEEFHGAAAMSMHALSTLPLWLAIAGVATAYVFYMVAPQIPAAIRKAASPIYTLLDNKYYMDDLYFAVFAKGSRLLGTGFWKIGDQTLIDGLIVNGSARVVGSLAAVVRKVQTGFIYSYATAMVIGVLVLLTLFVVGF